MDERIAKREYYSIGDVCDLTGLKPHVLRYWETQFDVLSPGKNRAGNRVYRPREVELVLLVKNLLYQQKYTIEGARQKLSEMRESGELDEERRDVLEPAFLREMKEELRGLLDVLRPPEAAPGAAESAHEAAEAAPEPPEASPDPAEAAPEPHAGDGDEEGEGEGA